MADMDSLTKREFNIRWIIIKCAFALAVGILVMLYPRPENLPVAGHRLIALLIAVVILWVTEAVPIGVTALLAGSGLILFNIQSDSVDY